MGQQDDDQYLAARKRVEARMGFYIHLAVYVVINVVFLAVVGWDFLWATVFWGLGLGMHAVATFVRDSDWARGWKERAIQRELARQRGEQPPSAPAVPARSEPAARATVPADERDDRTAPIPSDNPTVETTKPSNTRDSTS